MARRPMPKERLDAGAGAENLKFTEAAIIKIGPDGKLVPRETKDRFLLNPSTWDEVKSSNWSPHNVPGQSDPIFQWVSGGPRIVTFEALVTQDSSNFLSPPHSGADPKGDFASNLVNDALSVVGDIASSFAGVNVPPIADLFGPPTAGTGKDLSIAYVLHYYRSLMYPQYAQGFLSSSPPLVVLQVGETFAGANQKVEGGITIGEDTQIPVWIVTNLRIRINKQLPNLDPMEALVSFELMEYTVVPRSSASFGNASKTVSDANNPIGGLIDKVAGFFGKK